MLPAATIAHTAPGRIRFKFPDRRRDAVFLGDLERKLQALDGVLRVRANTVTGSILVEHVGVGDSVVSAVNRDGLFHVATAPQTLFESVSGRLSLVDRYLREQTERQLDFASLGLLLLIALGLVQLARGQIVAPAITLFWYATSVMTMLPQRDGDRS